MVDFANDLPWLSGKKENTGRFSRFIFIAGAFVSSFVSMPMQSSAAAQGEQIIRGAWGTAPGQYGLGMYGGGQEYPLVFAVDGNENIYVLDEFNNRVQHYDQNGNLLGEIEIQSDAPPTEEQKRREPMLDRGLGVDGMKFINGNLYALQDVYFMGRGRKPLRNILKMQGNRFELVATSSESAVALKVLLKRSPMLALAGVVFSGDPKLKQGPSGPIYDGIPVGDIVIDAQNNRWIISRKGDRMYNPAGKLLFQAPERSLFSSAFVTPRGDCYVLSVYSVDKEDPLDFQGVQMTRYQTK